MVGGLQGEEWKFIQKYLKKRSHVESAEQRRFCTKDAWAGANFAQGEGVVRNSHKLGLLCEIRTCMGCCAKFAHAWLVVRNSHMYGAVVFQRPYLPHFSSKSYTVWSVGFLTSWYLKWYISCRKCISGIAPKVGKKIAAAVLYFLHSVFLSFSSLPLSFTWLVLMIQKAVKTLKLATNMIRSHC